MQNQTIKLLRVPLSEERFAIIEPALDELMDAIHPLGDLYLPKELEPATYYSLLRETRRNYS